MLYQTPSLCFPFNPYSTTSPFSSSSSSSSVSVTSTSYPLSPPFPFSPSCSQAQARPEMDCVEAKALKGSFRPEMAFMKSSPQAFLDDLCVANGPNDVPGDDLFVDDLLDFSNDDVEVGLSQGQEGENPCAFVSSHGEEPHHDNSKAASFSISELSVPADDLADLEWLSHFVEDSFSEFSVPYPSTSSRSPTEKTQNGDQNPPEAETVRASVKPPCFYFQTPVPCKARSKRPRRGGRPWSLGSLSFTESSCTSSSSSISSSTTTTTTSSSSSFTSLLDFSESGLNVDMLYYLGKPPAMIQKNKKKKLVADASGSHHHHQQAPRRCSHCHVQKTPQWRMGPLGAKTLCNACGVRYKSGRLLPEYRPACSPTFSSDIHSNSHRKVLEMRHKKELDLPESGSPWLRLSKPAEFHPSGQAISST